MRKGFIHAGSATTAAVALTTANAPLAPADDGRLGLTVYNGSGQPLEIHATLASTSPITVVADGGYYEFLDVGAGLAYWGKLSSGSGSVSVTSFK